MQGYCWSDRSDVDPGGAAWQSADGALAKRGRDLRIRQFQQTTHPTDCAFASLSETVGPAAGECVLAGEPVESQQVAAVVILQADRKPVEKEALCRKVRDLLADERSLLGRVPIMHAAINAGVENVIERLREAGV